MDIAQLQSLVGRLTDQQLAQEANKPTGIVPMYMIMGEMQNRAKMRKSSAQPVQGYAEGGPVGWDDSEWELATQVALAEDPQQLPAVMAVIANRARMAKQTPSQVVTARHQFEPYTNGRYSRVPSERVRAAMARPDIQAIMRGQVPEDLANLTHFFSPGAQAALGRDVPEWGRTGGRDIGRQRYFALGYGGRPGPGRPSGANGAGGVPAPPAAPDPNAPVMSAGAAGAGLRAGDLDPLAVLKGLQGLMPDRTTPAFENLNAQIQRQQEQFENTNRGRPLMEMGLAMMGAKGPNFFRALGEGGAAGLGARDRIQTGRNALMNQLLQSQMGQATAMGARDASLAQLLSGRMDSNRRDALAGQELDVRREGNAADAAARAAALAQDRAQAGVQAQQWQSEMDFREREAKAARDLANRSRITPWSDPADVRAAIAAQASTNYQSWLKNPANAAATEEDKQAAQQEAWRDADALIGQQRWGNEWIVGPDGKPMRRPAPAIAAPGQGTPNRPAGTRARPPLSQAADKYATD